MTNTAIRKAFFWVSGALIIYAIGHRVLLGYNAYYTDGQIVELLNSTSGKDIIIGAFEAGESKDPKFIPLLIKDADDPRGTSIISFKGFNVYEEKMAALEKILKVSPPGGIKHTPDSAVIRFYTKLISDSNKR
jgi:hypothetical protein